jgi:hypothetical protein
MTSALEGEDPGQFQPPPELTPRAETPKVDTSDMAPAGDESH